MDESESQDAGDSVESPAVSLEIGAEVAAEMDRVLREFAEDGDLDTALVVDRGGALVTGISSDEGVTVEVISGLVAGASGAMRALVRELGETGEIESFHQGDDRVIYLRDLVDRFVLVGVCTAPTPVGVIREKARQVRPALVESLATVESSVPQGNAGGDETSAAERPRVRSLRAVAEERAAARAAQKKEDGDDSGMEETPSVPAEEAADDPVSDGTVAAGEPETEPPAEELFGGSPRMGPPALPPGLTGAEEGADGADGGEEAEDAETVVAPEPREIIELIGDDSPEIVIEGSGRPPGEVPAESPFEIDEAGADEAAGADGTESAGVPSFEAPAGGAVDSVFELEDDESGENAGPEIPEDAGDGDAGKSVPPLPEPAGVFEIDADAEDQLAEPPETSQDVPAKDPVESIFETDEEEGDESGKSDEAGEAVESIFESDDDGEEDGGAESDSGAGVGNGGEAPGDGSDDADRAPDTAEAEKEEEAKSPGPFYF